MRTYNHPTTAENAAFILARDIEDRAGQESGLISHKIISVPNGQQYGINGHVPCDHSVLFTYANNCSCVFHGSGWIGTVPHKGV